MPKKSIFVIALVFVASIAMARQVVPGTSVNITPPNGYVAADKFPGFMNQSNESYIKINELPGTFSEVSKRFSEDRIRVLGITILSKSTVSIDGHSGILLHTEYSFQGTQYKVCQALIDRLNTTTTINARYPATLTKEGELLKSTILAATLGKADPTAGLTFSVEPTPPFKVAMVLGQTMILSPNGRWPIDDRKDPTMTLGLSACDDKTISDKKAFMEKLLAETGILNTSVSQVTPIAIGKVSGYATKTKGNEAKDAVPVVIYQIFLSNTLECYVLQGITPSSEKNKYMPIFENIAKSFIIKPVYVK